ncbi:MAG: hypothetical protein U5L05_08920 [Rubrivivax sp.]|nr:hypothetical protein [Rubrivivax sp.]
MNSPIIVHDRRRDLELRAVFNEVYARIEGFFDPTLTWGGPPLTMWVYRVVQESYPQLDAAQVQALVAAAQRVYRTRHARGAPACAARPTVADPVHEPA